MQSSLRAILQLKNFTDKGLLINTVILLFSYLALILCLYVFSLFNIIHPAPLHNSYFSERQKCIELHAISPILYLMVSQYIFPWLWGTGISDVILKLSYPCIYCMLCMQASSEQSYRFDIHRKSTILVVNCPNYHGTFY